MECSISIYDYNDKKLKTYNLLMKTAEKLIDEIRTTYKEVKTEGSYIILILSVSESGLIGFGNESINNLSNQDFPKHYFFSPSDLDGILKILEK
ncbi:hypothetical protein ASO14_1210 [Kurthia sp. 11kri321]|uniref:hypothetical protein n=1 Tax=Kurthia sp. 11kri321 TaxID=1750719 RepID=UPI000745AE6D|nr:hypothetical protein [Kurthia sp. 11kri321]AMA64472.1 hypothetical protein ASO14_1210 [Kurthia sp. 11kri321]